MKDLPVRAYGRYNAQRRINDLNPVTLRISYADDLLSQATNEPHRLVTSRVEVTLLTQDNAELRQTDWIDLAQDRDQWRPLVNTAMNLWVP
jgi:tRNA U34 5-carboxymethylaminomethyl modifying enzyme MnmG/GidA